MSVAPTRPRPSTISPYFYVDDGEAAIAFYGKAFGAEVVDASKAKDGKRYMHVQMRMHGASFMFCDDFPEFDGGKSHTAKAHGGSPVLVHVAPPDADAFWKRATDGGATVKVPFATQHWGERYGQLVDPFGITWSVGG